MATNILIIHGQLPFAIKLKQALERSASFEAHPFTTVEAALDYLTDHVQDIALVDFALSDFPGDLIVRQLRSIQVNIPVIATPHLEAEQLEALGVLASLDRGFNARDLVNLINSYFSQHEQASFTPPATTALLSRMKKEPRPAPKPPENLPEYSSLDDVISSAGGAEVFEPPRVEGDTPPSAVSELVWAEDPPKPESTFDDVLNALPAEAPEAAPRNPFTDLVNSMRTDEQHRPLPSRQQQFVEYILTGGMDSLLEQIEQSQNDEDTPKQPSMTAFERLAQEEPPPPSFEESGTVSDLVTGVHDRSFRNVLSILRGEEIGEESESEQVGAVPTPADFDVGPRIKSDTPRQVEQFNFDDEEQGETPAKVILQRTLEKSMSVGGFSLDELLASIDAQLPLHRPKVLPLPSWLREQQRGTQDDAFLVREPDFLPEQLPEDASSVELSEDMYPDQPTQPARGQVIEAHPEVLETEWLQQPQRSGENTVPFPETLPEEIPSDATIQHVPSQSEEAVPDEVPEDTPVSSGTAFYPEPEALPEEWPEELPEALSEETPVPQETQQTTGVWYNLPEEEFNTQFEMMAAFQVLGTEGVSSGALYTEVPVEPQPAAEIVPTAEAAPRGVSVPAEDPYLAQLALSLTEVSLELTAEATLLARDQKIVAYAGRMPAEEIEELRGTIADDWDAASGEVRIRFITAQNSGKDYMLYSRRTEDDFTLSLIFAGTTPLRDIRRQGTRLVNALASVPEAPVVEAETPAAPVSTQTESVDVNSMTPYACVWLLRDPGAYLDEAVSQAIVAGLNIQMHEQQWNIQTLQVREDYVYMLADVPGEDPAYQIVRDLQRRSAEIAHAQNPAYVPDSLWADSYLVVTPGRELDLEEIQQFINFDRME
jgi:DNA-binding NarL/FixJ family response regulator/REP element-mobilizing transposase RayT